ncbi:MAG: cysteine dioxygenase family protein [Flavobacteriales bacterium]|nr:cysteine dioxygenase family protein [Flavobacteriales bacterium]HRN36708.1 cysteine dioxygenase family protein [Flavobacteriales bacterium]HRO40412.1 cysteine dioxygenase family protein [Flavobacteriales bacterium]HRP80743.1 cysteine dioxygenase family protein [Flavobacteriales bacterium]
MALTLENRPEARAIDSLEELVRVLSRTSDPRDYSDAFSRLAVQPGALEPLCLWNPRHYARQCLHRTREHELLLICYEPGQRTSIHDYDSQQAWILPLQGNIQEERFTLSADGSLELTGSKMLVLGTPVHMDTEGCIHRHSNMGPGRAITLNLYARPIRRWRVYDERTGHSSMAGTADQVGE